MSKKQKFDDVADSDELQALFDSIAAGGGASVEVEPVPSASAAAADEGGGDDDSLQALFDEVAAEFDSGAAGESQADAASVEAVGTAASGEGQEQVFTRIGQMTRHVHEALRALSNDNQTLAGAVEEIPDARQRLNYIMNMTEQAASRVLNATDVAKPMQDRLQVGAEELGKRWDRVFANELSVDEFKALTRDTRGFLSEVDKTSAATGEQLMEIMMAQDFQDLTGQVIKRVVELAQTLESELLEILIAVAPEEKKAVCKKDDGLMNGPVVDAANRNDVVTTQEQVDDLLDSLGF